MYALERQGFPQQKPQTTAGKVAKLLAMTLHLYVRNVWRPKTPVRYVILWKSNQRWIKKKETKKEDRIIIIISFIKCECIAGLDWSKVINNSVCSHLKAIFTDYVYNENHVIDWENAKVIDRESDKAGRLIREAIWIKKTENMNRDEGSYQLSHVWDKLLHTDDRQRKSVLMKASDEKPKRR